MESQSTKGGNVMGVIIATNAFGFVFGITVGEDKQSR